MANLEFMNIKRRVSTLEDEVDALQSSGSQAVVSLNDHINSTAGAHVAEAITLAPIVGLASSTAQAAINELLTKINNHIINSDAHNATQINIEPLSVLESTTVQQGLEDLEQQAIDNFNNLQNQIDGLAASQISVSPPVGRTYNNVQSGINVIEADIATLKNDSGDHETLIQQLLTAQLNQNNTSQVAIGLQNGSIAFSAIVLPTSAPGNPVTGSAYFSSNQLRIWNGSSYVSVNLT